MALVLEGMDEVKAVKFFQEIDILSSAAASQMGASVEWAPRLLPVFSCFSLVPLSIQIQIETRTC